MHKVFVWKTVPKLTNHYHCSGGLVVFAKTEKRAREMAKLCPGCKLNPNQPPDLVRQVLLVEGTKAEAESIFVFPDAGCC